MEGKPRYPYYNEKNCVRFWWTGKTFTTWAFYRSVFYLSSKYYSVTPRNTTTCVSWRKCILSSPTGLSSFFRSRFYSIFLSMMQFDFSPTDKEKAGPKRGSTKCQFSWKKIKNCQLNRNLRQLMQVHIHIVNRIVFFFQKPILSKRISVFKSNALFVRFTFAYVPRVEKWGNKFLEFSRNSSCRNKNFLIW